MRPDALVKHAARRVARALLYGRAVQIVIDCRGIDGKGALLQAFAAQMHFPTYFRPNWDAFRDCIMDLSWLDKRHGLAIVLKGAELLKQLHPEDWEIASGVLLEAVAYWRERNVHLLLVFC